MRELKYLKAVVIVHGKSEKQLAQYVKSKLRLKIEIESDKNGEKSIQITSLDKFINNKKFKSLNSFLRNFEDAELNANGKKLNEKFKIFIIMDTDDCTEKQKEEFIKKIMFKKHWAYDNIVPIYNSQNLEDVLTKAKIPFEKKGDKRKKEYIKIFPTDKKYERSDEIQIKDLKEKLEDVKNTNLDEFLEFCLEVAE